MKQITICTEDKRLIDTIYDYIDKLSESIPKDSYFDVSYCDFDNERKDFLK